MSKLKVFSDVIISPLITEKTTGLKEQSVYTFKVAKSANKVSIRKTLEEYFSVKVKDINIVNIKPKLKERLGRTRRTGVIKGFKKAYVTLKKGDKITALEV